MAGLASSVVYVTTAGALAGAVIAICTVLYGCYRLILKPMNLWIFEQIKAVQELRTVADEWAGVKADVNVLRESVGPQNGKGTVQKQLRALDDRHAQLERIQQEHGGILADQTDILAAHSKEFEQVSQTLQELKLKIAS